jgi:hypothetical protein
VFTVNDLGEPYIGGTYVLENGQINLTQDNSNWADLEANITITSGEFNVYGGNGDSFWPYAGTGFLTMGGGVLDFKDIGIYLYSDAFTENITGGVIRTSGSFQMEPGITFFTPAGGAVESYGGSPSFLASQPGCYFHDFWAGKDPGIPVSAISAIDIKGELWVKSGRFLENGQQINVGP